MMSLVLAAALAASEKPVVSVMYFENRTGNAEFDVLRKGLSEMMVTDLVAWDGVTVVERARFEEVLAELKLQQSKAFDQATVVKIGKLVGAQFLVEGTMARQGQTLRVDAWLRKVETGVIVGQARAEDQQDKIFDIEQQLVDKLTAAIGTTLTPDDAKRRKAKVPTLDALVAYSKAIDLSDQGKLKEAQEAMAAVVSKAPTFLLARERRDELLKRFQEYELKKKDLVTGAALELGKLIDAGLKDEARLGSMTQQEAQRYLTLRMLKGRYILRVLKQHLSSHGGHTRVALRGHEGEALLGMRTWLENQRRFDQEYAAVQKKYQYLSAQLPPDEAKLVAEAKFGSLGFQEFIPGVQFVVFGMADDGDSFRIAPALGFVDAAERKKMLDELETRIVAAIARAKKEPQQEYAAGQLIEMKANAAIDVGDVDSSVTALQRFLDAFPTSGNASRFEERIKHELAGSIRELDDDQRWAKAMKTCETMDLIVGAQHRSDYLDQFGLPGLEKIAKEMEKACPPSKKNRSAIAQVYSELGRDAASHDDCALYQSMTAKSLAQGESVRDTLGWGRNLSWCDLAPVMKDVPWFFAKMDRDWDIEFVEQLTSSESGGAITLSGVAKLGTPYGVELEPIMLKATRDGSGWRCAAAEFTHYSMGKLAGECSVTVKKVATGKGDFDEGTWSATFPTKDPMRRKLEFTDGQFKVKRQ